MDNGPKTKIVPFQQFLLRFFFQNQFRIFSNMIKDKKKVNSGIVFLIGHLQLSHG